MICGISVRIKTTRCLLVLNTDSTCSVLKFLNTDCTDNTDLCSHVRYAQGRKAYSFDPWYPCSTNSHCPSTSAGVTSGEVPVWVIAGILWPPLALREWPQW